MFRARALDGILKQYTAIAEDAVETLQYDQGYTHTHTHTHTHTPLFIRRSNGKLAEHLKVRTDGCQLCCSRMVGLCSTALPAIASPFVLLLSMNFSSKEEDGSRMLFVVSLIVLTLLT